MSPCRPTPPQEALQPQQGVLIQPPVGSLLLFSGHGVHNILFMSSKTGVFFFPSVLWKSYNQILLAFRVRFPGLPVPLSDPMAGKPDMGFRTFTTLRELLWHYCSPACGSPTQKIWDLIFFMTVCLLLSNLGFFFFSGCGVCSFGGFQCHPVWLQIFAGCPPAKLVAILVLSQEEDEYTSFYYLPS